MWLLFCVVVTLLSVAGTAPAASGGGLTLLQSAQNGEAGKALAFRFLTYDKNMMEHVNACVAVVNHV